MNRTRVANKRKRDEERLEALKQEADRLNKALFDVAKFANTKACGEANTKACGEVANYTLNLLSAFK